MARPYLLIRQLQQYIPSEDVVNPLFEPHCAMARPRRPTMLNFECRRAILRGRAVACSYLKQMVISHSDPFPAGMNIHSRISRRPEKHIFLTKGYVRVHLMNKIIHRLSFCATPSDKSESLLTTRARQRRSDTPAKKRVHEPSGAFLPTVSRNSTSECADLQPQECGKTLSRPQLLGKGVEIRYAHNMQ